MPQSRALTESGKLRLDQEGMEQALEVSEIKKKNQEAGVGHPFLSHHGSAR